MEIEEETAQGFDSDAEDNIQDISGPLNLDKIKYSQDKIIETLQTYNLIKSQVLCPICNKGMTMVNTKIQLIILQKMVVILQITSKIGYVSVYSIEM